MTASREQPPRIALFLPSLRAGGAERAMLNLAEGLAERGFRVDLVLASATGPLVAGVPEALRIVDLHAPRVLASLPGLVRYLRDARPVAMVSALNHANMTAIWARALARVATRLVISERSTMSRSTQSAFSVRERVMPLLARVFYPMADAVAAVSQGVADDLMRLTGLPAAKVHVAYNPAVGPDLYAKAREPLHHAWFAPGAPPVVLAAGRLSAEKDLPTLIKAFDQVRRQRPARLLILGEGEERPQLESLIKDLGLEGCAALPGLAMNPYPYMAAASVFVLSSIWEGLPNALIEALALGAPVVSTDCPNGPREILEGGRWGRLVPVGDPAALATAILEALASPRGGDSAQAVQRFTRATAVSRYLELMALPSSAG